MKINDCIHVIVGLFVALCLYLLVVFQTLEELVAEAWP